jgi:hypothetical protein
VLSALLSALLSAFPGLDRTGVFGLSLGLVEMGIGLKACPKKAESSNSVFES